MVEPKTDAGWVAYTSSGGPAALDPSAIALYQLSWKLAEISGYTQGFRAPHADDDNTRAAWANLQARRARGNGDDRRAVARRMGYEGPVTSSRICASWASRCCCSR
jgi:hypothetical protein